MGKEIRGSSLAGRDGIRVISVGAGILLATAVYVGVAVHGKDTIAAGTTVAGHPVGGMTRAEATAVLRGIDPPTSARSATVRAGRESFSVQPDRSFRVDAGKTLSGHIGMSLNPASVWRHAVGAGKVKPTFALDRADLEAQIKRSAQQSIAGAPRQGKVMFVSGKVVQSTGKPGRGVDTAALTDQIAAGWPKRTHYATKIVTAQPDATTGALTNFARGDARRAMASSLRLKGNGHSLVLSPTEVSDVLSADVTRGVPHIVVDAQALGRLVLSRTSDFIEAPQDAKVVWKAGKPTVANSTDGRKIDRQKLADAVGEALVADHDVMVPTASDPAQVKAADIDPEHLPQTSMARFTSAFPQGASQAARIHNITTATRRLDGTVVMPGQQFSLLRTLGHGLTTEKGYVKAGTLQNGMHLDGMGGGVSQVSTVLYNTAFFSGVRLDSHTPHAVWISRYPMGREATLWNPSIDNTWTNDTGHPILITAQVRGGQVSMEFRGTKKYEVTTRTSGRYRVTPPRHRTVRGVKGCENTVGGGTPGFSVDVWRALKTRGATVRTEKIHTTYAADDVITCR